MSTQAEKSNFLMAMTVTELAFILFFLLLLLASVQLLKKNDTIKKRNHEIQELVDSESHLASVVPALVEWVDTFEGEELTELKRRLESDPVEEKKQEDAISALVEENEAFREAQKEHEKITADLKGQLQNRERMLAASGSGHGLPPCWANPETGKAEYIYRIVIRENDLQVEPRWGPGRADDVGRIPSAAALPAKAVPMGLFDRKAQAILKWSKEQDPECRHYVIIADEAETKDGYKRKRLMIENVFYKYEERRR